MKKLAINPFNFGDPVEEDCYLPRPGLSSSVKQFLENQIHVVFMGPRRFGKISFALNLLKILENEDYNCIIVMFLILDHIMIFFISYFEPFGLEDHLRVH